MKVYVVTGNHYDENGYGDTLPGSGNAYLVTTNKEIADKAEEIVRDNIWGSVSITEMLTEVDQPVEIMSQEYADWVSEKGRYSW